MKRWALVEIDENGQPNVNDWEYAVCPNRAAALIAVAKAAHSGGYGHCEIDGCDHPCCVAMKNLRAVWPDWDKE